MGGLFLSLHPGRARRAATTPLPAGQKWHLFSWRHGAPKRVLLTGSFSDWSDSEGKAHEMRWDEATRTFVASVPLDPSKEWQFKFVVDGQWRCSMDYATVPDGLGNMNNIIYPE